MATRVASGKVINALAKEIPWLIGGSADLGPSTRTIISEEPYFNRDAYLHRNITWGIREHVMCAASSGMALHGGLRPYASTFLVFSDYARPAIRLAALMKLPVIYVMTHDSIGLGEDGPTHQPVEHLPALRTIPNLCLIRPADANEVTYAWKAAMERKKGPTMLILSRQGLPVLDRNGLGSADGVLKGGYVLASEKGPKPDIILIGSGSEVHLLLEARGKLDANGVDARVVSMPSWELFEEQPEAYRYEVLLSGAIPRLAVEAAVPLGWCRWLGQRGDVIGIHSFGASAPGKEVLRRFGFSVENVVRKAKELLEMSR
jgi:transketolase